MFDSPLWMVEDEEALGQLVQRLAEAPVIAVDTEADSMHHYRERICLIQITDAEGDVIIDPLAIPDLSPLGPILADPGRLKIVHGGDYDVACLRRDFGFQLRNLFDTMISAQILGFPKVGLTDLTERFFGVQLDKQYQKHNWSRRPLQPEHLDYARGDTHYLPALREILERRLHETGRWDVAEEEFRLLEEREWGGRQPGPQDWVRVKGARTLDPEGLKVLRAVYGYRDEQARRMDRPPYKVIPEHVLLEVARRRPRTIQDLESIVRPRSPLLRRHGEALLQAVRQGLASTEPAELPVRQKTGERAPYGGRDTERLWQKLRDWRNERMNRDGLPQAMLASNAQLRELAAHRPATLDELAALPSIRQWQVRRHGQDWLDIIARHQASRSGNGASSRRRRGRRGG